MTDAVQVYEGEGITPQQAIQNIVNTIIKTYPDRFNQDSAEWLTKKVTNQLGRLLADWNIHVEEEEYYDEQDEAYRAMKAEDEAKAKKKHQDEILQMHMDNAARNQPKTEQQQAEDQYAKDFARDMGYPK